MVFKYDQEHVPIVWGVQVDIAEKAENLANVS